MAEKILKGEKGRGVIAEKELSNETDKKYCTYVHVFRAWFSKEES
jgi:hypothetical protein